MNDFADVVEQLKKRKKYVKYEFQSYGLELANKLEDKKRLSMYMKLAKEEPRGLLNQALGLALDAKHRRGRLGDLFLWHLKDLKAKKMKRIFIALVPKDKQQRDRLHGYVLAPIFRQFRFAKTFRFVDMDQLHITLFFHEGVPEEMLGNLLDIGQSVLKKYNYPIKVVLEPPKYYFNRLIAMNTREQVVFRTYYTIKKAIAELKLPEFDFYDRKPFFHLTLGRRPKQELADQKDEVKASLEDTFAELTPLKIEMTPQVIESQLTKNGYRYKILG